MLSPATTPPQCNSTAAARPLLKNNHNNSNNHHHHHHQQQQNSPWDFPIKIGNDSSVVAVLGAQWGDEGKGKLVDYLANSADVCCRFNGGSNAGHTVVADGHSYALHLIPCGILYPHTVNLLGNGVVIHMKTLIEELQLLEKSSKIPDVLNRVLLSTRAHLVFDFHVRVDGEQETQKKVAGGFALGTTKRGIGPCYSSKMARTGLRVADLLDFPLFEKKYRSLCSDYQRVYEFRHDCDEEIGRHRSYVEMIGSQIVDSVVWIHQQLKEKKKILVEGANATFLDIDFGTYPFVTSSSTTAGGICTGLGIPPALVQRVIGVVKAYVTRVGSGPFLTELNDETGEQLRDRGREFGTTTGRPRRCGWLDTPMVKYSKALCGFNIVNLTKLDVLTGLETLKLCTAYRRKSDGSLLLDLEMPSRYESYSDFEPVYEEFPGWTEDIQHCRTLEQLPVAAQNYVKAIQRLIDCPVVWVGVGRDRENTVTINYVFTDVQQQQQQQQQQ